MSKGIRAEGNVFFSAAITKVLKEAFGGVALRMSQATGVPSSSISYYCRVDSNRFPTRSQLQRLIEPLSDKHKKELVSAFFADQVPSELRPYFSFKLLTEPAPRKSLPLPAPVEAAFDRLREAAANDTTTQSFILATAKAMAPKS